MQYRECTSKWHGEHRAIPLSEFSRDKTRKDGYHNHCRACRRKARQEWHDTNRVEIYERVKDDCYENHDENKAKSNVRSRRYKVSRGIPWALLMSVKTRANKRGLEFNLTEDDLQIPAICPIFGTPFDQTVGPRSPTYPTVDRIDNTKGYTKDNICIISWRANNLKGTATLDELIMLGEFATQQRKLK